MGEAEEVLAAARLYGLRLAEQIINKHGLEIPDERVDGAVAEVTGQVLQRAGEIRRGGMPTSLAMDWAHECINALMDRILEHTGYLLMGAALVAFDPWLATHASGAEVRTEPLEQDPQIEQALAMAVHQLPDPKLFGVEVAEGIIARMYAGGLTEREAAALVAEKIAARTDEMLSRGLPHKALAAWTEQVADAYGERLHEHIHARET